MTNLPLIADIRRNSLDDGPGIRSVVFSKGCPLRCVWCHNPECISPAPELLFSAESCEGCGDCIRACPTGAVSEAGPSALDRSQCDLCGDCVKECLSGALSLVGKSMSVEAIVQEIMKDKTFYANSGGGVTLSGGEPTFHMDFSTKLARALKKQGVHVCLETCGDFDWNRFESELLPFVDLVYVDIKFADEDRHRKFTGRGNARIKSNILRLAGTNRPETLVRVPLVPELTATPANLSAIAQWLREKGIARIELLPYNPLWPAKLKGLGKAPSYRRETWMTKEEQKMALDCFAGFDVAGNLRRS